MQCPHHIWATKAYSSQDYCDREEQAAWKDSHGARQATATESQKQRRKGNRKPNPVGFSCFCMESLRNLATGTKCWGGIKSVILLLSCKMLKKNNGENFTSTLQYDLHCNSLPATSHQPSLLPLSEQRQCGHVSPNSPSSGRVNGLLSTDSASRSSD